MTEYTWVITQLDCIPDVDGQTNVVSNIHWRVSATDGTHTAEAYGCQSLTLDPKNAFISYADLTKDQILTWAQESIGIIAITELQEGLDKQLESLANPPVVSLPLPWAE